MREIHELPLFLLLFVALFKVQRIDLDFYHRDKGKKSASEDENVKREGKGILGG